MRRYKMYNEVGYQGSRFVLNIGLVASKKLLIKPPLDIRKG